MIEKILELMKLKGVNAKELTSKTGLYSSAVTDWKKGKSKPNTEAIIKMATYFGVSTDYLLGHVDNSHSYDKKNYNSNILNSVITQVEGSKDNSDKFFSKEETELLRIFDKLEVRERYEVLSLAMKLEENQNKK